MPTVTVTRIKPVLDFTRLTDPQLLTRVTAIQSGLPNNPAYPNPPIDPAAFKTAVDSFSTALSETVEASKKFTAERQKSREVLTGMLRSLAHYVEDNCNGDMSTLLSSGFKAASTTRAASHPLPQPKIIRVDQGSITGQLLVVIKALKKARHYEMWYAPTGDGGTPGAWTQTLVATAKTPVNGLTPGKTYTFQVRAYNRFGYSDWSDTVSRMCI